MDSEKPPQPRTLDYALPPERAKRVTRWWVVLAGVLVGVTFIVYEAYVVTRHDRAPYRMVCMANLRQIGMATLLYAQDHSGQFPDGMGDLSPYLGSTDVFVCPSTPDEPATGPTTQAITADLAKLGHCSYIYCGKGLTMATCQAGTIIAYEPLVNHGGQGMNVLYGDGSVKWSSAQAAAGIIAKLPPASRPTTMGMP